MLPDVKAPLVVKKQPIAEANGESASEVWKVIQNTSSAAVLEVFIEQFPDSIYAKLASAMLGKLKDAQ